MFIADTSKTSEKECLQVNYNKWTNNFKDEKRSVKVCEILKLIAKHGLSKSKFMQQRCEFSFLAVDSTVLENENGIETERQKTTAEILAEYDSKVNLVEDKVCVTKTDGKTECFTGLNDIRICEGEDCYSETIPCEVCFLSGISKTDHENFRAGNMKKYIIKGQQ